MKTEAKKVIEEDKKNTPEKKKVIIILVITVVAIVSLFALVFLPPLRVAQFGINDSVKVAELENSYRATTAQIIGGFAIIIGLYYTWQRITIAENNLKVAQEGQITERFTRAIEQLGNENLQIRLGGIYALERIANESEKDYWPVMEILTAYIRINSPFKNGDAKARIYEEAHGVEMDVLSLLDLQKQTSVSFDIEAIISILKNRRYRGISSRDIKYLGLNDVNNSLRKVNNCKFKKLGDEIYDWNMEKIIESRGLDLQRTYLAGVNFYRAHLESAWLSGSFLEGANLGRANLEDGILPGTIFKYAKLENADFRNAFLLGANFEKAYLSGANFEEADLQEADLRGAQDLLFDQLSKVRTLYNAKLDEELLIPLKEKYPALFEKPNF